MQHFLVESRSTDITSAGIFESASLHSLEGGVRETIERFWSDIFNARSKKGALLFFTIKEDSPTCAYSFSHQFTYFQADVLHTSLLAATSESCVQRKHKSSCRHKQIANFVDSVWKQ